MIVHHQFQCGRHIYEMPGRPQIGSAWFWIARRMIVRDQQAARVEIERPANRSAQRQAGRAAMPTGVEILRNEQSIGAEIEHQDAFFPVGAKAAGQIMTQPGIARFRRLPEQFLSRGQNGDIARDGYRCNQQIRLFAFAQYGFGKCDGRCRMNAPQRAERPDQAASEVFRPLFGERTEDPRQDRKLPRFFRRRMCAVSPHAIAIVCA